jgi:predicted RNA binding protein YcfA (HicA-like mRNA interferase family)
MPVLPVVSGEMAAAVFTKAGWRFKRRKGSHAVYTKPGRQATLSIPMHDELDRGTLRGLIRASEMTVDEFIQYHDSI